MDSRLRIMRRCRMGWSSRRGREVGGANREVIRAPGGGESRLLVFFGDGAERYVRTTARPFRALRRAEEPTHPVRAPRRAEELTRPFRAPRRAETPTHPSAHSALRAGPRCWQSSEYRASPAPRFNSEGRGQGGQGGKLEPYSCLVRLRTSARSTSTRRHPPRLRLPPPFLLTS